ncbi:MAG: type III secretion protein [Deltaproteobacteria bacterium HGW-Deltaproteobacteria-18]|jgi:type III secretion system needle length determinant|nr:MAG: type III secretion protein [Deltaproteobacteria bacterium HGW-Deltaproteobacteria-18]
MPDFMKVDSARLERAGAGEEKPGPQQPDKDSVQRFQDSMETKGRDHESRPERSDKDAAQRFHDSVETKGKNREGRPGDTPGDAFDDDAPGQMPSLPLNDLFSGRMTSITPGAARPEAPMPPSELAEKLVERILVGQTADGGQEVRLRLGPDVLPGTEIRMTKGPDGTLQVVLITDNASSFQTLVAAQNDLKARLESLDSPVRIDITSESGAEDNDSNRRSRGWIPETDESR